MKRRVMKMKLISTSLLLSLLLPLFVGIQPVSANPSPPPENQQPSTVSPEEMQKAIRILDPYVVRREDGTFKLTVQEPQSLGIRPEVYKNLVHSMEKTNQLVRQDVLSTDKYFEEGQSDATLTNCPGSNYVQYHWWGIELGLNHCATNNLIYLLDRGATVAGIASLVALLIPTDGPIGEVLCGLAGAVLALGSATYEWADNMYGCGSVTYYTYSGSYWVNPQQCC